MEDVAISRASMAETSGQIEQLEQQIKQTVIKAPDDGLVAKRDAHIGDITNAGAPLFSLIRLNRLELRAQVPDIDLSKFKTGQPVNISANENDGSILGRVSLVSPQVDLLSRLGTVRIKLPSDAGLKPGMFVRGQVDLGQHQAITVPVQSVITRNGESFVFTLEGDRAVSIPVSVGARTDSIAEVTKGLQTGQIVINEGARFLSDRDVVRVSQ
jgi:HlyD family secretion protein